MKFLAVVTEVKLAADHISVTADRVDEQGKKTYTGYIVYRLEKGEPQPEVGECYEITVSTQKVPAWPADISSDVNVSAVSASK